MNELSINEEKKQQKLLKNLANKIDKLIDFWNELANVTKHRKNTQTYKECKALLKALIDGTFISKYPIDPQFIKRINIDSKYLNKYKFPLYEIKENLVRLSLLCSPGYSITKYPYTPKIKRLNYLLYNVATNSSYFLLVVANPPKLCAHIIDLKNLPFDEYYLNTFLNTMHFDYANDLTNKEKTALGIKHLINFHKKTTFQNEALRDLDNFLYVFLSYLKEKYTEIKPYMFNNRTFIWNGFCKYIEQQYQEKIERK